MGRVTAPFGVQGWVRIRQFSDDLRALPGLPRWWLGRDPDSNEGWQPVDLLDSRLQGDVLIARLAGVADRNAAEALKGIYVGAPRDSLPRLASDEFYCGDLIGLATVTERGQTLGKVVGLVESGAHDVLVVEEERDGAEPGRQRLLPFVANVIRRVDLQNGVIRVDWDADW